MSEGVIKYRCDWTREPIAVDPEVLAALGLWRSKLRGMGFIGVLPEGIGFGNISVRVGGPADSLVVVAGATSPDGPGGEGGKGEGPRPAFLITGSGTGGLESLDASHLSLVTDYRLEANFLACRGLTQASSESLSHAAIYAARPDAGAVIHIHSEALWKKWKGVLPTTEAAFAYGTPEMAVALGRLVRESGPGSLWDLPRRSPWAIVMGGHREGLMIFGPDLEGAGARVLKLGEGTVTFSHLGDEGG